MNILEKLSAIQIELKAPKNQFNKFGGYNYRNCEDILEAVKPLCSKNKATLVISDSIENIGERFYVKAMATLYDSEKIENSISAVAFAREEENKKGMDGSQVTGSSSSYARKYALNGLFNIDDTKDADSYQGSMNENTTKQPEQKKAVAKTRTPLQEEIAKLSKDVSGLIGGTPKEAYKTAIDNLGVKGETEEEQAKIVEHLKGIIENAKV